ncbi:hypothetical protein JAAARDRAFT_408569 [Jaapia argillacea MUCL 33604]|uniref:Uncharacterized protein n=1 Tax=Jaapia argillacea MUCL 33604 TaxID=933084 RepID=A0A067PUK7_9AGAM|nr:hypothetical protein JAAARDRAFT_408569 [Jaapia argillacea MUCL 33604]
MGSLFATASGLFQDATAGFQNRLAQSIRAGQLYKVQPLERLLCANVDVSVRRICPNEGKMTCSACKLVSYCSKKEHWPIHKRDCKDNVRSKDWKPAWVVEGRASSVLGPEVGERDIVPAWLRRDDRMATSIPLWGNMPAVDVINLDKNEGDPSKDFSVAFPYLKNVVRTINSLPPNYSGQLTILLNDREPYVVIRNLVLLLLLGTVVDHTVAAEVALHFWYSAFVPSENSLHTSMTISTLLRDIPDNSPFSIPLGSSSSLSSNIPRSLMKELVLMLSSKYSMDDAQIEYKRVRFAPSRIDHRHHLYERLEPSHRLAFHEYRRFGLILPFGALNGHFNFPNRFLFSPNGRWLQDDAVDPLDSWDIQEIIKAGKGHGAQPSDVYGCLYFFLSEQLRNFALRLRQFRVSFHLFNRDASDLARALQSKSFLTLDVPTCFDRIDVSNMLDIDHAGVSAVLASWSPFLNSSSDATIIGYFKNWVVHHPDARPSTPDDIRELVRRLVSEGKVSGIEGTNPTSDTFTTLASQKSYLAVVYDNSKAFSEFLSEQDMSAALQSSGMKLKETHTIVPPRLGVPVDGLTTTLPVFPDRETWYLYVQLGPASVWSERFVEFTRT